MAALIWCTESILNKSSPFLQRGLSKYRATTLTKIKDEHLNVNFR